MEFGKAVRKVLPGTQLRDFSAVLLGIVLATPVLAQAHGDQIWNELASGNRRFVTGKSEPRDLVAVVAPIATSCTKVDKNKPGVFDVAARDHVHSVAQQLLTNSVILKKAAAGGKLTIIEAYYSLDTGQVAKLR